MGAGEKVKFSKS